MGWKAIAVIHMRDDNGLNQGRNSRVMREDWALGICYRSLQDFMTGCK